LPISANLGFDYALTSFFTFGADYNFQGGGPTRLTQTLGSYLAAREVIDVYGLWKMSGQSQVRLSFANVVKQDGQIGRFYEDEAGSLVRRTTTPTSTGVRLTLERKF
jgi:outer membrane receptor for ferrienterochelin and colicins